MDRQQLEALAREIRAAARSKGMGLRRLTAASGVAHTTILRMARGDRPRAGTIMQLAAALGQDASRWLAMAGYGTRPETQAEVRVVVDPPGEELLRRIEEEQDPEKRVLRAWEHVAACPVIRFNRAGVSHEERLRMVRIWEDLTGWTLLPENRE